MIDAAQLDVLADKAGLEIERAFQDIPSRHATTGQEDLLEQFGTAAEVQLGHMLDWRVLWSMYLRKLAGEIGEYLVRKGSGEVILYERLMANPDILQKVSSQGFPCRVTLTRDGERGILSLEVSAVNYKPGQLPAEFTGE